MTLPPRCQKKPAKVSTMIRCPGHLVWLRGFQCIVRGCKNEPAVEAAHVRVGTDGGTGMKPSDIWAVPVCRTHHRFGAYAIHTIGERQFEREFRLDLRALAQEFAAKSPALARQRAKATSLAKMMTHGGFGG